MSTSADETDIFEMLLQVSDKGLVRMHKRLTKQGEHQAAEIVASHQRLRAAARNYAEATHECIETLTELEKVITGMNRALRRIIRNL